MISQLKQQQVVTTKNHLLPTFKPIIHFAAIDCEWRYGDKEGFIVFSGNSVKLHRNNYSNDYDFLKEILNYIEKYDTIAGHNITGDESDITQIQSSCRKVGLESRFSNIYKSTKPLDTWKIF
jgi:hypothetical protein